MSTLAVSLAAQITALDARLASIAANSMSADGVSVSHPDWVALSNQRMKLQAMLDIGGSTHVTGTFRVQGADLVLALDNAQRKMNQFRV